MEYETSIASQPADIAIPLLLDEHGGRIYSLGVRLCGGPEEAEDLVQETFLRAFQKWDQFEGRAHPATWLYAIAARVCRRRKRLRAGEPRRMAPLSELLPSGEAGVPDIPYGEGPLDAVLRREAGEVVERGIAMLPVHFRLPLVLKDIAEFSVKEVSRILGLKETTVKTRVHRARLMLRKALAEKLPQRSAPSPNHAKQVCLDLLRAKQEALDRGAPFPFSSEELCSRCQALFATLDLARDVCTDIRRGRLPTPLRQALIEAFKAA